MQEHLSATPVQRLFQKRPHHFGVKALQLRQLGYKGSIAMKGRLIHQRRHATLAGHCVHVLERGFHLVLPRVIKLHKGAEHGFHVRGLELGQIQIEHHVLRGKIACQQFIGHAAEKLQMRVLASLQIAPIETAVL